MQENDLRISDLNYSLPGELIAQEPLPRRSSSRLLTVDVQRRSLRDMVFSDLPDLLLPGDLIVCNNTRVFRARIRGWKKGTGGRIEVFLLKRLEGNSWKAMVKPSRAVKPGRSFQFDGGLGATVLERLDSGRAVVEFQGEGDLSSMLEQTAEVPLPPYIERLPEEMDDIRYQTVFASETGAVAAPTAGLHFDDEILSRIRDRGIELAQITLHVGPGTFQPLRNDLVRENRLDPEEYTVSPAVLEQIQRAKAEGRRIVAVGTTTTRVLESIQPGSQQGLSGETDIFIFPPYRFRNVDALITNFHLPGSSLLCLVAAFMGLEFMMETYRHAVEDRYRFYSYGDAMFIQGKRQD